jgi:hypothetical protein
MSYENFSYKIEMMKKSNAVNELTQALNSGISEDLLYQSFRDVYDLTINSRIVKGKDGLNVDGLFADINSKNAIYSLLDLVKAYIKCHTTKVQAIEDTINLVKAHYLIATSDDERTRHLTHIEDIKVGVEGDIEKARFVFWNTLKSDLTIKVNELLD